MSIISEVYENKQALDAESAARQARFDALEASRISAQLESQARAERLCDPRLIAYNDAIRNHPDVAAARVAFEESVSAFDSSLPLSLVKKAMGGGLLGDNLHNQMSAAYIWGRKRPIAIDDGITVEFTDTIDPDDRHHDRRPIVEIKKKKDAVDDSGPITQSTKPKPEKFPLQRLMPIWDEPVPTDTLPAMQLFRKRRTRRDYIDNLAITSLRNQELAVLWEKIASTVLDDYKSGKDGNEYLAELLLVGGDIAGLENAIRRRFDSIIERSGLLREIDSKVRNADLEVMQRTGRRMSYSDLKALRRQFMAGDPDIAGIRRDMEKRIRECRGLIQDAPAPKRVVNVQDRVV